MLARERALVLVGLDEVLAELRTEGLQEEAQVRSQRVVAAQRAAGLHEVGDAEQREHAEHDGQREPAAGSEVVSQAREEAQRNQRERQVARTRHGRAHPALPSGSSTSKRTPA